MVMDSTSAAEARERVAKWIEETRQIFSLLPELMAGDHHAGAAQKEVDRLHKDLEELKREGKIDRLGGTNFDTPRTADLRALTNVHLLVISGVQFRALIRQHAEIAENVIRHLVTKLEIS
jgi:CRP-like cAMP-binding protein